MAGDPVKQIQDLEINDDLILALAGIGAALTAAGVTMGAAEAIDTVADKVGNFYKDPVGSVSADVTARAEALLMTSLRKLGYGRKGGLL